ILADNFDVTPGWYWFRHYEVEKVVVRLIMLALFGDDTQASVRSFEILRRAQVSVFTKVRHEVLERRLREISSSLQEATWSYLVDVATAEDLDLLGTWASGTWLESRIEWLKRWVASGRNLDAFLP